MKTTGRTTAGKGREPTHLPEWPVEPETYQQLYFFNFGVDDYMEETADWQVLRIPPGLPEVEVYRDMQTLELAGVPVEFDQEDKCYRIRQDFRFPVPNLTVEEALAQGTAAAITAGPGLDINPGARSVSRKLAASAKEDIAQVLADAAELVAVLDLKLADHSRHRKIIRTIQWALVRRKQLAGSYRSPYEAREVRLQLHPYRLGLVKQAWYVIGRPTGEDAPRTFRVARFKTLRITDANAELPDDFDLKGYFGNAWAAYRGDQSYDVEILFTGQAAATVTESVWHHTQRVRRHKDGRVTLTFQVDGLNEIVRWVLGWGSRGQGHPTAGTSSPDRRSAEPNHPGVPNMIPDWGHNCVFLADLLKGRYPSVFASLQHILSSHGIEVRLLTNVKDIWARDYSPVQVAPETLVKFRYHPDYLEETPELRTGDEVLESLRDMGRCSRSSIVLDGGNVVGSNSKAIVTEKIYRANAGWTRPGLRDKLREVLRVDQLIVIPKEPFDPIGHADGMVRFIDERAVLVNDYSGVDPRFGERLLNVLRRHGLATEQVPYFHEKKTRAGIPSSVGCVVNFLRTEKVVVAPVYGTERDRVALGKLESVLAGLPVVPLDCTDLAREGGVLNCVSASYRSSPKTVQH